LPLPSTEGNADVLVTLGEVDRGDDILWRTGPHLHITCSRRGRTIVLDWPTARFAIEPGRVVVQATDPEFAGHLLLQAIWSVVLDAHGRPSLHGTAVERDGCAVGILGRSGSGKSTAALALLDRGWRLVADDVLTFDDTERVVPGPPFVRLRADRAVDRIGTFDAGGKLRYYPAACPDRVPLAAIIVHVEGQDSRVRLVGMTAAAELIRQTDSPVPAHPAQARHAFDLALDVAGRVPIYAVPPRSLTAALLEEIVMDNET